MPLQRLFEGYWDLVIMEKTVENVVVFRVGVCGGGSGPQWAFGFRVNFL